MWVVGDGKRVYQILLDEIDDMLEELDKRNELATGFRDRFTLPTFSRTEEDLLRAFDQVPTLKLEVLDQHWLPNPYWSEDALAPDGRAAFGDRYVASIFSWGGRMIAAALNDDADRVDDFRRQLSARLAARAEDLEMDYAISLISAKRT